MARELSKEETEKALKGIAIPPRPTILADLMKEMRKEMCDSRVIARLISADVSLAAATLKTVNSPFFGVSREVSSVQQAVTMLGMRNVSTIATGLLLRGSIRGDKAALERFWDGAERLANIGAFVAGHLKKVSRDDAYTYCLFRDCGMPVLMQKFPGYNVTLDIANQAKDRPMTDIENERLATNHAVVGYLMAKAWYLPAFLCDAIHRHHEPDVFNEGDDTSPEARKLIAIGALAERLYDETKYLQPGYFWESAGARVLEHLGLDDEEYADLREEILTMAH